MGNSLFKLTSLNLNGIRSATTKGLEPWLRQHRAGLYLRAGSQGPGAGCHGRFDELAGLKGYFHFAEKKGYSGVGVYTGTSPAT